jgi:hypothetical protein
MPLINTICLTCDHLDEYNRPVAEYPRTRPCSSCGGATEQRHLPPRQPTTLPDAVIVYVAPDGSYRFPGETSGAACAKYDALGYRRVEARGFAEVRTLESKMNRRERAHMERIAEAAQARREHGESLRRSELFHQMRSMSARGRDVAQAVIDRHNARRRSTARDPGLHVDAYQNNRGSRDESRRGDGKRHRD